MKSWAPAILAASSISESDSLAPRRMLARTLSSNRNVSWATYASSAGSAPRASWRRSRPSMLMPPVAGSQRRASSMATVDFPAPVGPTIATVLPGATEKSTPTKTGRALG